MVTRSTVVTAAIAAASALAATGITYASAATTELAHASPVVQQATAPVSALDGGDAGKGNDDRGYDSDRDYDDRGHGDRDYDDWDYYEGRIQINERTYSDDPGGCITVVSGLGSNSLNIRNDSRRTVEVFRGATCDNGAPIATVGPHSSSDGVFPGHVRGGVFVHDGVVGSFRVLSRHYDSGYDGGYDGW
ncbi:hypothetical protein [Streptomyces sp. NPDC088246]|uniref:hypothetical protein n=1 Tax=Streptomyces sp. NPDC088246 TaxID=3365842 RepID=UPI0037FEB3E7